MKLTKEHIRVAVVYVVLSFGAMVAAGGVFFVYKAVKRYVNRPTRFSPTIEFAVENGARVFAASSLDRIFQDGKTLLEPTFTEQVSLTLARHEYESFQVVVQAVDQEIRQVSLRLSDLAHENGQDRIPSNQLSWRVVGYVKTATPYYPVKYVGLWPDPLLPARAVNIEQDKFQPFWVTVYASKETVPGIYHGAVEVEVPGLPARKIPLTVKVYHFTLPVESRMKTAFDFYPHVTAARYPQKENESDQAYQARIEALNDAFLRTMLRYRINPILNVDPTNSNEMARVDRLSVLGLNLFSVGKKGGTFENNWPKSKVDIEKLLPLYRTYGEILKLNKFLTSTYIYTWDEGEIGNPVVPMLCSMIHRAYPGLRNLVCYHGFWDPVQNPEWGKDIDIWCFQIDKFDEGKIRKLQSRNVEVWTYPSGPSGLKTPNLALDFDSIDYRILPWLCWKYDIKGILYWCVNWWVNVDPFESARNTRWKQNGNGLLFYPGENGPLVSLRLELLRDGLEDYEYFEALMRRLKSIRHLKQDPKYKTLFDISVKYLRVDTALARSMDDYTRDGEVLKCRRDILAGQIEEFDRLVK